MGSQWGGSEKQKIEFDHSVVKHWPTIKETYDVYSNQLILLRHQMNEDKFLKTVETSMPEKVKRIYELVRRGIHTLIHTYIHTYIYTRMYMHTYKYIITHTYSYMP